MSHHSSHFNADATSNMKSFEIGEIEGIWPYLQSIDWSDPWLKLLLGLHVIITFVTILSRHHSNVQAVLFFVLLLLVYFSENINEIAAKHWQSFSREQYFDSKGMFISFVFSVPLLFNCLIMVANWTYQSANLMVSVKKKQLHEQRKKEKDKTTENSKKDK